MAPIFDRSEVLASPYPPAGPVGTLVLEFAILGQVDLARDLHAILNREYPMNGLDENVRQLALCWNATGNWPEGSQEFEDEAELEALKAELEEDLWPEEIEDDNRTMDEVGLKRILKLADEAGAAAEDGEDDEEADAQADLSLTSALVKALDMSIKLAEDKAGKAPLDKLDDQSEGILKRIAERLHRGNQTDALAGCARAWPYLARGELAQAAGTNKEKLEALGKDIKETTEQWFSKGPQPWSPSSKSLKDLLQTCSDRSKEFWQDEYDEPAPETLFASSGATKEEVEGLEKKLDAKLPEDYKEFLATSDGFMKPIADGIFEDFEVSFLSTKEIEWRNHDDIIQNAEDDDEEDEDDDGEEMQTEDGAKQNGSSRAAKKIKLDDGLEASTKDIEDNSEDEEEIEGLEYLQGIMNTLQIELLPLPATAHYEITEELEGEWPEVEKVVEIGASEDASLWLLPADQVKKVRDAYMKVFDSTDDESLKKAMSWAMVAFIGGEEAFRKLDTWVYVAWSNGHCHCWASFRRYLEELADTCTKLEKVEDEETALRAETLAYSCR